MPTAHRAKLAQRHLDSLAVVGANNATQAAPAKQALGVAAWLDRGQDSRDEGQVGRSITRADPSATMSRDIAVKPGRRLSIDWMGTESLLR